MTLYVVTEEGVYRHRIVGVYDTLEAAKARAEECIQAERDCYHRFEVGCIGLNAPAKDTEIMCTVEKNYTPASMGKATYCKWV